MHILWCLLTLPIFVWSLDQNFVSLALDYFHHKDVQYVSYLSCEGPFENIYVAKQFLMSNRRVLVTLIGDLSPGLETPLQQRYTHIGVLMDGGCGHSMGVLDQASRSSLFDSTHMWLIMDTENNTINATNGALERFQFLNLSVDADIALVSHKGDHYRLTDVFNFGNIQGNKLETQTLGTWDVDQGLKLLLAGFKYYHRWDFHNLTLRAISVMRNPKQSSPLDPSVLWRRGHHPGVSYITTIAANLLNTIKQHHNFRFNYTIAGRWVDSPNRNSVLAVTNSLFWRQQDVGFTSMRLTTQWLPWVECFVAPVTILETKFYYLVSEEGVGCFENRFLTPLSGGVWACTGAAAALSALMLAAAAARERRPQPITYAAVSVLAAFCQQGRRVSMVVVGVSAMLVYNYYTSSVVSWLLSAAPPSIASVDQLVASPLQLAFEDVGYTRGWLDEAARLYYYSGWKNPKEDALRTKAMHAPRTLPLLMPVEQGIELVRTGEVAYHAEPLEALRVISRHYNERQLCALAALQMMPPSVTYVMGQPRSPYKQFFVWSLLRLLERGITSQERRRVQSRGGRCGGKTPRALALGQAAPALILLAAAAVTAVGILAAEIVYHRVSERSRQSKITHKDGHGRSSNELRCTTK